MAEEKLYGIGEVQSILKKEFPDITISKLRFLEKEDLISPQRTKSGYRKYSKGDIKQLSYILRLQREEYLPLAVIKKKIQDLKSGKVVAGDLTVMSGQAAEALGSAVPVSIDLAPSRLGLTQETIAELIEFDIVAPKDGPEGKYFSPADMKILTLAKEFFRYGIEPRHLRMYTQFTSREASFIEQIIRPQLQHKDPNSKRSAIKDLENLIQLSQLFTEALLKDALAEYLPRPAPIEVPDDEGPATSGEMQDTVQDARQEVEGIPVGEGESGSDPSAPEQEMFPDTTGRT